MFKHDDYWYTRTSGPLEKGRKYGLDHSWECTCGTCQDMMALHIRINGGVCFCPACNETIKRLELIAETERRGVIAAQEKRERKPVANISICDRPNCGSMAKSNVVGSVDMRTGGMEDHEKIYGQICPACVESFVAWWELETVGKRERAYSKAWVRPKNTDVGGMSSAQLMQLAIEKGRAELDAT